MNARNVAAVSTLLAGTMVSAEVNQQPTQQDVWRLCAKVADQVGQYVIGGTPFTYLDDDTFIKCDFDVISEENGLTQRKRPTSFSISAPDDTPELLNGPLKNFLRKFIFQDSGADGSLDKICGCTNVDYNDLPRYENCKSVAAFSPSAEKILRERFNQKVRTTLKHLR